MYGNLKEWNIKKTSVNKIQIYLKMMFFSKLTLLILNSLINGWIRKI